MISLQPVPDIPMMNLTQRLRFKVSEFALPLFILALAIATGLIEHRFWSSDNLVNLSRQLATLMVISVGQALAVISGGLDLSLAAVLALSGVCGVMVMNKAGLAIGILIMVLTGAGFGLLNGMIITTFGVSPFIVTLGMLSVARGLALIATGGLPLYDVPSALSDIFGFSTVFGIPTPALIAIATLLIGHGLLHHTVFGRYVYAIGSNTKAAFNSGINVRIQTLLVYTLTGTTAGIAAVVLTAWVSAAQPLAATGLELQSLAAVVVGGVALTGGMGSMLNAFYGVLILGMLSNSLNMIGVSSFMQTLAIGLVIVVAVVLDKVRRNAV